MMTISEAQQRVDQWIKTVGVRYFNELTNMAILTEEVGEVARIIARRYGEQSFKESDKDKDLGDELADVMWVVMCLANQTGVNLEEALECYDTSVRILNVIYDEPRSQYDYALTQFNRARILHSLGRDEECHQACIEVERSLSSKKVREEKRSEDVKKLYLAFRKELSGKN